IQRSDRLKSKRGGQRLQIVLRPLCVPTRFIVADPPVCLRAEVRVVQADAQRGRAALTEEELTAQGVVPTAVAPVVRVDVEERVEGEIRRPDNTAVELETVLRARGGV